MAFLCSSRYFSSAALGGEIGSGPGRGTADPVSGAGMVRRYRELITDADVVTLRNVGHYPHFEQPWDVFTAYRAFRKQPGLS